MKTQKLAECCTFFSGGTPTKGKEEYWRGDIPWFSPKDIKNFDLTVSQDRISYSAIESSATRLIEPGTILVVGRSGVLAHTLPVGIVRQPSTFNQDIKAIVPDDSYDSEFIALCLKAKQEFVLKDGVKRGPTVHSLIADFIEHLEIPKIPIEKQRQIAARLKAQLAEVDKARQAAEAQLRDADVLGQRIFNKIWAELDSVPRKPLGDYARTTSGSTPARGNKQYWQPAEVAWVKTAEVAFVPITKTEEAISQKALAECSLTLLPPKTVLIAMYGQGKTRGQSALLEIPATTNQACFAILPNSTWEPEFLFHWLKFSYQNLRTLSEGRGGNQANLNGGLLKALQIPTPDKPTQKAIIARIENVLTEIEAVKNGSKAMLNDINLLPQKILAQAFEM